MLRLSRPLYSTAFSSRLVPPSRRLLSPFSAPKPRFESTATNPQLNPSIPPPPPKKSRLRRTAGFFAIAIFAYITGTAIYSTRAALKIMAEPILTDEQTLDAFIAPDEATQEIEDTLKNHPEAQALRANPEFKEARPHLKIPATLRPRSLTAGTLSGPNKIVVPPYIFSERDGKSLVSLMYLGSDICGHPGIVHGGLLATLLDEGLARCCFPALPNKIGVTANLNIDYRAPAMADQYIALRAETVKVEGRKAWVEGRIETLPTDGSDPVVLVEAKALFIEPKQAAALSKMYRGANE